MTPSPRVLRPTPSDPKRWRVRWYDETGRKRQKSFRKRGEADAFRDQLATHINRGLRTSSSKLTVEQLATEWWNGYVDTPHIAKRTATDVHRPALTLRILPYLGQAKVADVDRKTIDGFVAWMGRQGVQPPTIRNTLNALSSMFQRAVEWDYVATNPVRGVRRPKDTPHVREVFEPDDVFTIAAAAKYDRDKAMIVVSAFTGMRPSELWALTWNDVTLDPDPRKCALRVYRQKTKTHTELPMFDPCRLALMWWREIAPTKRGLVFATERGGSILASKSSWHRRQWRPALAYAGLLQCAKCQRPIPGGDDDIAASIGRNPERAGVWGCSCGEREVVGPQLYDLRHTFGSLAALATGDAAQVAEWMGHSDASMLLKRYKHQLDRGRERAIGQMNTLIADWSSTSS